MSRVLLARSARSVCSWSKERGVWRLSLDVVLQARAMVARHDDGEGIEEASLRRGWCWTGA